jgi:hypothetical protein
MTELIKNRQVMCDLEVEREVFKPGKYYVMTPRFDFVGELVAVTAMTYVFQSVAVVFESGPYKDLFSGKGKDVQPLEGADRTVFDRAGCVLHHFAK